jgi:hypothetical protein
LALFKIAQNPILFNKYQQLFSKSFSEVNRKSKIMKIILKFGSPLNVNGIRYKSNKDRIDEQNQYIANWQIMLSEQLLAL